jgi:hypothetical protein
MAIMAVRAIFLRDRRDALADSFGRDAQAPVLMVIVLLVLDGVMFWLGSRVLSQQLA